MICFPVLNVVNSKLQMEDPKISASMAACRKKHMIP